MPTGVPEPGLILWGTVVNTANPSQPISITSASWLVSDGTRNATYTQLTRPPVRTFYQGEQQYYVLEVPFDTRRFGTIQLDDPAAEGVNSFQLLSSSPPTYVLTPSINGAVATVRSVDGAPSGGGAVPLSGFTAAVRGRVMRVDLSVLPITESYEQWAQRIFGDLGLPTAQAGADPDGDGLTNAAEFAAGTNPLDPTSALRVLQLVVTPGQATVSWQSVATKSYVLESAPAATGPWTQATSVVAASASAQATVTRSATGNTFFRVRAVAP